jgi:hypothetical protein
MARPVVTIPPVTILMEMAGYGSLTEWLARPLPKEHVAKLSPDARRTRKRAQVRMCKARKRLARAVSNPDALLLAAGRNAKTPGRKAKARALRQTRLAVLLHYAPRSPLVAKALSIPLPKDP